MRCSGLEILKTKDEVLVPLLMLDADDTEDYTAPALQTLKHIA